MRLQEITTPINEDTDWDSDMDIYSGLGRLWHKIKVQASYSHQGPYDREMEIKTLMWPEWEVEKEFGGQEGLMKMLQELEQRGKIELNQQAGTFRIAPEVAQRDMEAREKMAQTVADWEKGGGSFTAGT